jgi:hypothetical protein
MKIHEERKFERDKYLNSIMVSLIPKLGNTGVTVNESVYGYILLGLTLAFDEGVVQGYIEKRKEVENVVESYGQTDS